jgi:hypothetical protein
VLPLAAAAATLAPLLPVKSCQYCCRLLCTLLLLAVSWGCKYAPCSHKGVKTMLSGMCSYARLPSDESEPFMPCRVKMASLLRLQQLLCSYGTPYMLQDLVQQCFQHILPKVNHCLALWRLACPKHSLADLHMNIIHGMEGHTHLASLAQATSTHCQCRTTARLLCGMLHLLVSMLSWF